MPFLKHIFSVEDNIDKTRRTVTFLGIKINVKIKPKRKKISKNTKINNFGITISNDEVVILANGPSLNDSLSDKDTRLFIESKDKICVNCFPLSEQFLKLRPNYLLWIDSGFWCSNPNKELKESISKITSTIKNADWDINIILPQFAKESNKFTQIAKENPHIKPVYVNTQESYWNNDNEKFLEYKTNYSMPGPQNVLVASLYCAINIGYKKIHIFGADHNWHKDLVVDDNNIVCIQRSDHFYDEKNKIEYKPLYKHPGSKICFTMSEIMSVLATTYEKYELLERYSKFMGSKIYNMSKVSYIDAFERKKLGEKEYVEQ